MAALLHASLSARASGAIFRTGLPPMNADLTVPAMLLRLIREPIDRATLAAIAAEQFGDMVKAVVDVGRGRMVVGGELHSDEESLLVDDGSRQSDLWGINLYPATPGPDWVEFDSMINVRPGQNNPGRDVVSEQTRGEIRRIVASLVTDA